MVVIFLLPTEFSGTWQDRHAIDMHGAGAAVGDAAAVLGAGEAERVAQHPEQRRARIGIGLHRLSIDVEYGHDCLLTKRYPENGRPYRAGGAVAPHTRVKR